MKESEALDRIFHALSDSTRRELLAQLSSSESTVTELAEPFKMTLAAVSKHIRVLEAAGFVKREVDGRIHRCKADLAPLQNASQFIEKYRRHWEKQFDMMDNYFKKPKKLR